MGINDRLDRLEDCYGPPLCEERPPCRRIHTVEVVRYSDGSEDRMGDPPPELCSTCPERENPRPHIRTIEVVCNRRRPSGAYGDEPPRMRSLVARSAPPDSNPELSPK